MGMVESKRIQRLYDQVLRTRKNCSFEDIERLLLALGFDERKASGSHRIFKRGRIVISIPQRRPVKENYVEHVLAIVDELGDA
jgi:predicted RNA binding protein YcfA (HicA-like mRNA interferase family)